MCLSQESKDLWQTEASCPTWPIKYSLVLGTLQIATGMCILIVVFIYALPIWWFSIVVGLTGLITLLSHRWPEFSRFALVIFSILSLLNAISLLIYCQKSNVDGKVVYAVIVLTCLLQCSLSIICLIMVSGDRNCICCLTYETHQIFNVVPQNINEARWLLPLFENNEDQASSRMVKSKGDSQVQQVESNTVHHDFSETSVNNTYNTFTPPIRIPNQV